MPTVIGVDSSTQATKVEVRDADDGALVASGRASHPVDIDPPRSEQDPRTWWSALDGAWRDADANAAAVAAIAVAGQQHGMVVLDDRGEVIRPAKLWNDTESAPDSERLIDALGSADAWAKACGSVPVPAFTVTKLAWLHRTDPVAWRRVARVALPHDWLNLQLTGRLVTDRGDASGTGYWSAAQGAYRLDLLAIVDNDRDWASALPAVAAPEEIVGSTTELGLEAVVAPGTGDNMAGALGVGLRPGDVTVSIGTSGTVYAVSATPTHDGSGAVAGFADATGHYLPLVCTLNAARVGDTIARLLGLELTGLDTLALSAPPGAGGVVLLPYFDGERTPNRPEATGTLAGLRTDATREQVARAAVEGVVCGLLDGLDALTQAGVDVSGTLRVVGGGARSAAYRQILADLSGRSVVVPAGDEHVALGAAAQAAAVLAETGPAEIAVAWGLGGGETIDPVANTDREAVRAAYATVRDGTEA